MADAQALTCLHLDEIDFSKIMIKKEGGKMAGDWQCCKVFYDDKEGIPMLLEEMYLDYTGKGLINVSKKPPQPGIIEGFFSFYNPARSAAWLNFLIKFNELVIEKIPLSAIPAEFKVKMDEEKPQNYGGVRAYEGDTCIYKSLPDGSTCKVPFKNFKSTFGNGTLVVRLNRIHFKNTEVKLKFRLHYAKIQPEAPLQKLKNPFMSMEEESDVPAEAYKVDE